MHLPPSAAGEKPEYNKKGPLFYGFPVYVGQQMDVFIEEK